ncbi:hypothetical protein PVK06_023896 [Gossypium arboreum]|uniref:Aminotransferase-like plant mobile domain-containing protein n=1 Tax=Gossypium arboreum TaxID=29729 RepID=A0ABR0PCM4_GOSAR|nr:hypothetical protein PVK06_023896 [Gossypium arboreum]
MEKVSHILPVARREKVFAPTATTFENEYRVLRAHTHGPGYCPDNRIMSYLEMVGFGSAGLIEMFELRPNLISALVEWGQQETYTFHLPCRECTITLEDIALQLELPVNGYVVTGFSKMPELAVLCDCLLGRSPSDGENKFTSLKFGWLKQNFKNISSNAT